MKFPAPLPLVLLFRSPLPLLEDHPALMSAPFHSFISFDFSCLSSFSMAPLFIYLFISTFLCLCMFLYLYIYYFFPPNILLFELIPALISPFPSIPLSPSLFNVTLHFSAWNSLPVSCVVTRFSCLQTYLLSGIPWDYLYVYRPLSSSLFNLVSLITLSVLSL